MRKAFMIVMVAVAMLASVDAAAFTVVVSDKQFALTGHPCTNPGCLNGGGATCDTVYQAGTAGKWENGEWIMGYEGNYTATIECSCIPGYSGDRCEIDWSTEYVQVFTESECIKITTKSECELASVILGDTYTGDDTYIGSGGLNSEFYPPYCSFDGSSLVFSDNPMSTVPCSGSYRCVCKRGAAGTHEYKGRCIGGTGQPLQSSSDTINSEKVNSTQECIKWCSSENGAMMQNGAIAGCQFNAENALNGGECRYLENVVITGGNDDSNVACWAFIDNNCIGNPHTNWDCCKATAQCDVGEGDCDFDNDCSDGLFCGSDNCLLYHSYDNVAWGKSAWGVSADCCSDKGEHTYTAIELSATGDKVVESIGEEEFDRLFAANPIVQYTRNGEVHSIYKRIKDVPENFKAYKAFTSMWSTTFNQLNNDFEIYRNLEDMAAGINKWDNCDTNRWNQVDKGYPGDSDCSNDEWFSMPGGAYIAPGLTKGSSFQLFGVTADFADEPSWGDPLPAPAANQAQNGGWGHWSPYGACSEDCGGGQRNRTRCCDNPWPMNGGEDCQPTGVIMHIEYDSCNMHTCAIHCVWAGWTYATCSKTCGTGTMTGTRTKLRNETQGGTCTGSPTTSLPCNDRPCPVDCTYTAWANTTCNVTCGDDGWFTMSRDVVQWMNHSGIPCNSTLSSDFACNTHDCPVDGDWGSWLTWSTCVDGHGDLACGGAGTHLRIRVCNSPSPAHGGDICWQASGTNHTLFDDRKDENLDQVCLDTSVCPCNAVKKAECGEDCSGRVSGVSCGGFRYGDGMQEEQECEQCSHSGMDECSDACPTTW